MQTSSALLALDEVNPPVTHGFSFQRPVARSFDDSFIYAWTNGWTDREFDGDCRRYDAHVASL